MRSKRGSKTEFYKKILITVTIATILIVIVSFVLMWQTRDLSPLSYIITGIFAELASATGFYKKKEKNENMLKIDQSTIHIRDLDKEAEG